MASSLSFWSIVGILVGSFILTQLLVFFLQRRRLERIERKSLELCAEVDVAPAEGDVDEYCDAASADTVDTAKRRVPMTIITGFLGSGKTTLVNRVLTSSEHGLRIVVIENELGAISIDHALIDGERQAHMPEGVVVLKNGCMCCSGETPGSELERVLDKLLEMGRLEGGSLPFDCVLIETTGMADPSPILQILYRREMAGSRFYLDAVICLVDAKHVLRHLQPSGAFGFTRRRAEAEKQLALADRIVLNKMDLLADDGAAADAVRSAIRVVNSTAPLMEATQAQVALSQLLGLHAFDSARWLAAQSDESAAPTDPLHSSTVVCAAMQADGPILLPRLQAWLQELAATRHEDLYRMKGVLSIAGHDERFVLHGIHAQVQGHFERPWAYDEPRVSALVVIAHRIDRHALEASFLACQEDVASGVVPEDASGLRCGEVEEEGSGGHQKEE